MAQNKFKSVDFYCIENLENLSLSKEKSYDEMNLYLRIKLNPRFFSDFGENAYKIYKKIQFDIAF